MGGTVGGTVGSTSTAGGTRVVRGWDEGWHGPGVAVGALLGVRTGQLRLHLLAKDVVCDHRVASFRLVRPERQGADLLHVQLVVISAIYRERERDGARNSDAEQIVGENNSL